MFHVTRFALVAALLVGTPALAHADIINAGDTVRFLGTDGTLNGGAFSIDVVKNGDGVDFLTFCLQRSEFIDYSSTFTIGGITDYADDAAGPDYLSGETKWIYRGFRLGTLTGYSSDEIQSAIWTLENEWNTQVGNSAQLIALAHSAIVGGASTDGVKAINLFYSNGAKAQDQLTFQVPDRQQVPEPASLLLMGVGLAGAFRARRKVTA